MVGFGLRNTVQACAVLFALGLSASCSTVPEGQTSAKDLSSVEAPAELTKLIENSFRRKIAFLEKPEIESYLAKVASRLVTPGKDRVQVELVSTTNSGLEPSVWVHPGGHIFYDVRALKAMQFENEIAASMAFAWERSNGGPFRERIVAEAAKADPDPRVVWAFSEVENERAIEGAVDRLYKAGYDPRGLVSFFDRLPSRGRGEMADNGNEGLKEKTRRALTFYAPLINPIVRTEDFYKMRKRLERL